MKIGVVVDSSCDLPRSFFENNDVELMPATITVGDHSFEDHRDDAQTIKFHLTRNESDETENRYICRNDSVHERAD